MKLGRAGAAAAPLIHVPAGCSCRTLGLRRRGGSQPTEAARHTHTSQSHCIPHARPAGHRSPALPGVAARETEGSSPFDLGERCGILQTTAQVIFTLVNTSECAIAPTPVHVRWHVDCRQWALQSGPVRKAWNGRVELMPQEQKKACKP